MLPSSTARSVAGTSSTSRRQVERRRGQRHDAGVEAPAPPGRSRGAGRLAYSWCITIADQAVATVGGACTGPSADDQRRIGVAAAHHPAVAAEQLDHSGRRVAACASTWAASWTPWPPIPVISSSRSTPDDLKIESLFSFS